MDLILNGELRSVDTTDCANLAELIARELTPAETIAIKWQRPQKIYLRQTDGKHEGLCHRLDVGRFERAGIGAPVQHPRQAGALDVDEESGASRS